MKFTQGVKKDSNINVDDLGRNITDTLEQQSSLLMPTLEYKEYIYIIYITIYIIYIQGMMLRTIKRGFVGFFF